MAVARNLPAPVSYGGNLLLCFQAAPWTSPHRVEAWDRDALWPDPVTQINFFDRSLIGYALGKSQRLSLGRCLQRLGGAPRQPWVSPGKIKSRCKADNG